MLYTLIVFWGCGMLNFNDLNSSLFCRWSGLVRIHGRVKITRLFGPVERVVDHAKMVMKKAMWKELMRLVKAAPRLRLRGKGETALKGTTRGNHPKMKGQRFIFFQTIKGKIFSVKCDFLLDLSL